jgi:hypothetical protein
MLKVKRNKQGAIELSIGTVVVIVLAMTMLILGIVLVRNIFGGATESVDSLNDKVKAEIADIFAEESARIGIKLGADKIAKIKQGTDAFGIGIGGQTENGGLVTDSSGVNRLTYSLELTNSAGNCRDFEDYVLDHRFGGSTTLKTGKIEFEDTEGPNGFSRIVFNIPKGAEECTQRIKVRTYNGKTPSASEIATASFRVQIVSGGIFS